MAKPTSFDSPNYPIDRPGRPALQVASEALELDRAHQEWHEDNPGQMCPPQFMNMDTYADIERGDDVLDLMGGGTIEPGDAFLFGK
jgi:hypothetical protein